MDLSKRQKQNLGEAIRSAGYEPERDIILSVHEYDNGIKECTLTHRETKDTFNIVDDDDGIEEYVVDWTIPGTSKVISRGCTDWSEVTAYVRGWALEVKDESQAVDPWQEQAEDMADDDSYFLATDFPKVDRAIDAALEDLKQRALQNGKTADEIQDDLTDIKTILKKSARTSTKKEWMSILKGCVVGAIFDWGLESVQIELLQSVLRTLIVASKDITYLAEHASQYIH